MYTRFVLGILVAVGCIILLSGGNAIAGCYPDNNNPSCEGNFDYDCDVDGTDAAVFKSHFGRSGFKNPCPSAGPAPVPRTGQTFSYSPGDDADLVKGVLWPNPRFTDNGDGTITDNLTGLIWLKNANCYGPRQWALAIIDCQNLGEPDCGLNDGSNAGDWRLPNRFELESLLDMRYWEPALSNSAGTGQWILGDPFTNLITDGIYWSSTTEAFQPNTAWTINMFRGLVDVEDKYLTPFYVWPVRGGQ